MINALRHQRLVHNSIIFYLTILRCDQRLTASKVSTHEQFFSATPLPKCDQRLTASKVSTPSPCRAELEVSDVINALRHQRLVHLGCGVDKEILIK